MADAARPAVDRQPLQRNQISSVLEARTIRRSCSVRRDRGFGRSRPVWPGGTAGLLTYAQRRASAPVRRFPATATHGACERHDGASVQKARIWRCRSGSERARARRSSCGRIRDGVRAFQAEGSARGGSVQRTGSLAPATGRRSRDERRGCTAPLTGAALRVRRGLPR